MKTGIVGAGSIGLWIAGRLADSGLEPNVLARGKTLKNISRDGITIHSADGQISAMVNASDDAQALGEQDLVIFAVKGHDLPAAAKAAAGMIGPQTLILPAMNGVPWWFLETAPGALAGQPLKTIDPQGTCRELLPAGRVIGGVVHASCKVAEPGTIQHVMGNGLIIGGATGPMTELTTVSGLLSNAGFDVTVSNDIRYDIWYKLWGNMTMNPMSALTGATCDLILDDPDARAFASAVMEEAAAIGTAIGCEITESPEDRHDVTRKLGAFKTSMLQDAEAGRTLEIGALLEAPQEIARMAGVKTPSLDSLLGLMRVFASAR